MRVVFLHHSCFLVEVDERVLIFDYFDGNRLDGFTFTGKIPTYAPETKIYMFASHSHRDHYDMDILRLAETYPNIQYILSKDVRISPNFLAKHGIDSKVRQKVTFVKENKSYQADDLEIQTLRSTDVGVAYYVRVAGASIFHAGDLNDWSCDGVGELINAKTKKAYRHEINKLKKLPINVAFVPADPRMMSHQFDGLDYFLETTDAEYVFPMHMWQKYSEIEQYKKRITNKSFADRIMSINQENQTFLFEEN